MTSVSVLLCISIFSCTFSSGAGAHSYRFAGYFGEPHFVAEAHLIY